MVKLGLRMLFLLGLVSISILAIVALTFNRDSPKYSYLSAITAKHDRLRATPSPRVIIIGGSSVAFGVDSARLQDELKMPVVNMGLHAGVGLRYMLSEVRGELRPGDIVIVSPEYAQFYGYLDGRETLLDMLFVFPRGLSYITSGGQLLGLVEAVPVSVQDMFKAKLEGIVLNDPPRPSPVYHRAAFNAEGDVVSHLDRPSQDSRKDTSKLDPPFEVESIAVLNEFARFATSRNARVYFLFSAVTTGEYRRNTDAIQFVCEALHERTTLTLLDTPPGAVYSEDYFFDTSEHLNKQGREIRTGKLVADLAAALKNTLAPQNCTSQAS
jgi:hypothetical protein